MFTFSPADSVEAGTNAEEAVVSTPAGARTVKLARTGQTISKRVTTTTFAAAGMSVTCKTTALATLTRMAIEIANGPGRLESIDFRLPQIHTEADPENAILSPFRGGDLTPWPSDHWEPGNSSTWPGPAFSPLLTVWNRRTLDTVGITYFSKTLTPAMLYWFAGPGGNSHHLTPFVRYFPALEPFESITLTVEYATFRGGPAAHYERYRRDHLAPFMAALGIPEAPGALPAGRPIVRCAWSDPGTLAGKIRDAQAAGASAFIQWSPPDGHSVYYNPYPPALPWFEEFAAVDAVIPLLRRRSPWIRMPLSATTAGSTPIYTSTSTPPTFATTWPACASPSPTKV
jgi:hypothetical protein